LPLFGREWRASKLPVLDRYSVPLHSLVEDAKVVRTDLVPEAPAAAVDHDDHLILVDEPELLAQLGVEEPGWVDHLNLQVVVAGAECTQLGYPPAGRLPADLRGVRSLDESTLLDVGDVVVPAISVLRAPLHAVPHQILEL